jgi:hypothetical protein
VVAFDVILTTHHALAWVNPSFFFGLPLLLLEMIETLAASHYFSFKMTLQSASS